MGGYYRTTNLTFLNSIPESITTDTPQIPHGIRRCTEVYDWLAASSFKKHICYRLFANSFFRVTQLKLVSGTKITLNKRAVILCDEETGNINAVYGEALIETRKKAGWFLIDTTTFIHVTENTQLNINSNEEKTFTITLLKGEFMVQNASMWNEYGEPSKQYTFDASGRLINKTEGSTARISNWVKYADYTSLRKERRLHRKEPEHQTSCNP